MGLNPKYVITGAVVNNIAEIERMKGLMQGISISEKNLLKLQSLNADMESHYSTHIEGTTLTLKQSRDILSGKKLKGLDKNDLLELRNYKKALDSVSSEKKTAISEALLKKTHDTLVKGVRGDMASPGKYRKIQNYVVNAATGDVVHTPPSPDAVPAMMKELVRWINSANKINPVIVSAVAQFQLVHIHPFRDGNGRLARILSMMVLFSRGYDFKKLFRLSEYYDKDRQAYYDAIQSARESGMNLTGWLEYYTSGLKEQLLDAGRVIVKGSEKGSEKSSEKIIAFLLKKPGISAVVMAESLGLSSRAVEKHLSNLKKQGEIKRIGPDKGGKWQVV